MSNEQTAGEFATDGEVRARDYTDRSLLEFKADIDRHYVSYLGLWNEWWKIVGIAITGAGVGAALVGLGIGLANWTA